MKNKIKSNKSVRTYNENARCYEWRLNGKLHRENGPAIEHVTRGKVWVINGNLHREDGPAIEHADGDKEWWINGKRHREDGPAIERVNGYTAWWNNGCREAEILALPLSVVEAIEQHLIEF